MYIVGQRKKRKEEKTISRIAIRDQIILSMADASVNHRGSIELRAQRSSALFAIDSSFCRDKTKDDARVTHEYASCHRR